MRIALCNEVIRELEFPAQCQLAKSLGYNGLELAPFTLGENPHQLGADERKRLRQTAEDAGIEIVGLHWLLLTPKGLSINTSDSVVREKTVKVMRGLIGLCAELGGKILVHGSPAQRTVPPDENPHDAWLRARDTFAAIAPDAEAAGVTYCIEPLSREECNFINTVADAVTMVESVGSPAIKTMLDHRAASLAEKESVPELLDRWLPTGLIRHIHVNDTNRRAPGQGDNRFIPVFAALRRNGYDGIVSVEPFNYLPSGPITAAVAIGYIRGVLEAPL
jgi:D-psicose/D-tagatose/L-ribulose 3-epimerase